MRHLHFGLDTLISLLIQSTSSRHAPIQADTLGFLAKMALPEHRAAGQLPRAAAKCLIAALERVLPEGADGAATGQAQGQGAAGELQPSAEVQAAYGTACRWGSGGNSAPG